MEAKRTLENSLRANYLQHPDYASKKLRGIQMLVSREGSNREMPSVDIVSQLSDTEGFESTQSGEFTANVAIGVWTSVDAKESDRQSFIAEEISSLMSDLQQFIEAMNGPGDPAEDSRPVKNIYCHTAVLESVEEETEPEERRHLTVLTYSIPFVFVNGDPSDS